MSWILFFLMVAALVWVVVQYGSARRGELQTVGFHAPRFLLYLFEDVRTAPLWTLVRLYLGWEWLMSGIGKVGSPAWTGDQAGAAITGFVRGALEKTAGEHPDVQGWYAWFLQNVVLSAPAVWSYLIVFGELLVGITLLVGLFTGIAAFFGGVMNANFLLSGTVSTNPIMLACALVLIPAWRVAGWYGLDRWVLPRVGVPWQPGTLFQRQPVPRVR